MSTKIPVFYMPEMAAPSNSFSPSSSKPPLVVADWVKHFPIDVQSFAPVTTADLSAAHDDAYVRDVLRCRRPNGFGNKDRDLAKTFPYTSGSLVAAAEYAIANGSVAVSPTSGFHHAGYDFGGGFCTFNGLMVTAIHLHTLGLAQDITVLDCDQHYGDGTDDIISALDLTYITHLTMGITALKGETYLEYLADQLPRILAKADVLIYQAGADPHVDDPLGGTLTTGQMIRRDRLVFEACQGMGVPVAWNLAGGYSKPFDTVIGLHHNTMQECVSIFC